MLSHSSCLVIMTCISLLSLNCSFLSDILWLLSSFLRMATKSLVLLGCQEGLVIIYYAKSVQREVVSALILIRVSRSFAKSSITCLFSQQSSTVWFCVRITKQCSGLIFQACLRSPLSFQPLERSVMSSILILRMRLFLRSFQQSYTSFYERYTSLEWPRYPSFEHFTKSLGFRRFLITFLILSLLLLKVEVSRGCSSLTLDSWVSTGFTTKLNESPKELLQFLMGLSCYFQSLYSFDSLYSLLSSSSLPHLIFSSSRGESTPFISFTCFLLYAISLHNYSVLSFSLSYFFEMLEMFELDLFSLLSLDSLDYLMVSLSPRPFFTEKLFLIMFSGFQPSRDDFCIIPSLQDTFLVLLQRLLLNLLVSILRLGLASFSIIKISFSCWNSLSFARHASVSLLIQRAQSHFFRCFLSLNLIIRYLDRPSGFSSNSISMHSSRYLTVVMSRRLRVALATSFSSLLRQILITSFMRITHMGSYSIMSYCQGLMKTLFTNTLSSSLILMYGGWYYSLTGSMAVDLLSLSSSRRRRLFSRSRELFSVLRRVTRLSLQR